jgi:hypothetical protein
LINFRAVKFAGSLYPCCEVFVKTRVVAGGVKKNKRKKKKELRRFSRPEKVTEQSPRKLAKAMFPSRSRSPPRKQQNSDEY